MGSTRLGSTRLDDRGDVVVAVVAVGRRGGDCSPPFAAFSAAVVARGRIKLGKAVLFARRPRPGCVGMIPSSNL